MSDEQRCKVCDMPMVSHWGWEIHNLRPPGTVARGSRALSLCRRHYQAHLRRERRKNEPPRPRRVADQKNARSREEVLEDYDMIRDDVDSVREAAERMGMTFSALDKALYRARKDDDPRGMPPQGQLERGLYYGASRHLINREAS